MRKTIAVISGVAAIALAAGCTSKDSGKSTSDGGNSGRAQKQDDGSSNVILSAFTKATDSKTVKFAETTEMTSSQSQSPLVTTATGVVDLAKGTGQLVSSAMGTDQKMTIVFAGDTIYEKLPPQLARIMKVTTPWAKYSTSAVTGASADGAAPQGSSNPLQYLSTLQGVADKVTKVGSETIDGTATTHYRATVDLDKAAAKSGDFKDAVTSLEKTGGSKTMPVEVWIDGQGRLRRESSAMSLKMSGADGKPRTLSFKQTVDLSDYGTPLNVTTPPADQTTDITKQMTS